MKGSMADQFVELGFGTNDKKNNTKVIPVEHPIRDKSFEKGKILKMAFDESDGIVPKDGYLDRNKYFVVMGVIDEDSIIGSFLINSNINTNIHISKELVDCQFPLKQKDYPFLLDYNSYLDCSDFFEISKIKILRIGSELGKLTDSDLQLIIEHIERTEVITPKQKKRFGFNDKS